MRISRYCLNRTWNPHHLSPYLNNKTVNASLILMFTVLFIINHTPKGIIIIHSFTPKIYLSHKPFGRKVTFCLQGSLTSTSRSCNSLTIMRIGLLARACRESLWSGSARRVAPRRRPCNHRCHRAVERPRRSHQSRRRRGAQHKSQRPSCPERQRSRVGPSAVDGSATPAHRRR